MSDTTSSLIFKQPFAMPDLLYLAVYNLLDNALKFSRMGDRLEVRAREDSSFVLLDVADTGPGIAAAELPHVWEELYRGAAARGIAGSGLGLSLVRTIIDLFQLFIGGI